MATQRNHQNNFATNLTSNQIAGVTTTPLNSIPSVAAPFSIALDATNINGKYEVVEVTSKTATNINHAATTYAHTTAEEVRMVVGATELDEFAAATIASSGADGWKAVTDTITYLSASSVTVPSGAASLYQPGDKFKFTQTTVKYFTVATVADTVLTFIVNTDYVVDNAAISSIYYSHQENPIGFPAFFNYTSTVTGMTTATATLQYTTRGRMCYVFMSNTSQTSNSATFNVTGPVTMSATPAQFFQGGLGSLDNGTWQTVAAVSGIFAGTNTIKFGISAATFAANAFGGFTASGGKAIQGIVAYTF